MIFADTAMNSHNDSDLIARTGFDVGFELVYPDGYRRHYPACRWHDDVAAEVVRKDGAFFLIRLDSRDHNFEELWRRELDPATSLILHSHDELWEPISKGALHQCAPL